MLANLTADSTGTVAAIAATPGSTISAQTAAVTVIGPGVDQVMTTVTDLNLNKVRIGAPATVIPDGSDTPVHSTVTAIGLLPVSTTSGSTSSTSGGSDRSGASSTSSSSSSSSSASYPVTVSLDSGGLYSGSGADVSVVVQQVPNVLTVPSSAVTSFGPAHVVTVFQGGKAVRKVVTVGATDPTLTQITSGLAMGDRVVLAQMNLAIPTSGTTGLTARALTGGGGGRGAGGFGGGGGFGGATGGRAGGATTRGG